MPFKLMKMSAKRILRLHGGRLCLVVYNSQKIHGAACKEIPKGEWPKSTTWYGEYPIKVGSFRFRCEDSVPIPEDPVQYREW